MTGSPIQGGAQNLHVGFSEISADGFCTISVCINADADFFEN